MTSPMAPPTDPEITAAWLTDQIAQRGLSQERFAQLVGVTVRTIGDWCRGVTPISIARGRAIRHALREFDEQQGGRS